MSALPFSFKKELNKVSNHQEYEKEQQNYIQIYEDKYGIGQRDIFIGVVVPQNSKDGKKAKGNPYY